MANRAKTNQNVKFDPTQFNKKFELQDQQNNKILNQTKTLSSEDIEITYSYPHQQPVENIIIEIKNLFFQVLDLIEEKRNPINFILASDKRIFIVSLFLIIFGILLLLLASLMKSPI